MSRYLFAALYHFVALDDYQEMQPALHEVCTQHSVIGTLLLAPEGINGTIAGSPTGVQSVLAYLRSDPRPAKLQHTEAPSKQASRSPLTLRRAKHGGPRRLPEVRRPG